MISFLRQLILQDFWLKLFSLVLACLIWWTVSLAIYKDASLITLLTGNSPEHELHYFNIPVLVMSSAADARDFTVRPSAVEVTITGNANILEKLQPSQVRAMVDLTGIEAARGLRKRIEVITPTGLVGDANPNEVEVIVSAPH